MQAGQPRRRSLGYSDAGVRLNVSFGEDDADRTREPISPGWLARDRAKQQQIAREQQRQRSHPDSMVVRARAMNNRVGIRESDSVRFARASPRVRGSAAPSSSPRASSPRSPGAAPRAPATARGPRAPATARGKLPLSAHAHTARPWGSQRAVGTKTEDLWKRSSATEYVRSLQSLSETLNHPRPLVQVTARRSIDAIVRKDPTGATATATGRMSAAEFVKKLQDTSLRSDQFCDVDASKPPWREPKQKVESVPKVTAPKLEPPSGFRTPPRDAAPVTAQTASSFSEWYAANRTGGSPRSTSPAPSPTAPKPEPEPEPEPRLNLGAQLLLQPASPSPSRSPVRPPQPNQSYSVMQHRSYVGSTPVASPRTVERRQRVHALASAARRT